MTSKQIRKCSLALCATILAASAVVARADLSDKKTIVTFSAPVEVPGRVLPAGTYQFRLLDSMSNRNIVQIFDKDGTRLYATLLTLPDYAENTPSKTIITFDERPSGSPEAIKSWFYPGDNYGNQFVYPQSEAMQVAKRTNHNVLSMRDEMKRDMSAPAKTGKETSVQEMENADVQAVNPQGQQVSPDQAATPAPKKQ
jgi:hypothetical protein